MVQSLNYNLMKGPKSELKPIFKIPNIFRIDFNFFALKLVLKTTKVGCKKLCK